MPQLQTKPLSWFKINPSNPRKSRNPEFLRSLGESMKSEGQLQPVGANPDGLLLYGESRFLAAKMVGLDSLDVIVIDRPISVSQSLVVPLAENIHRSNLSDAEVYLAMKELAALNPTWQKKDLAAHMHRDASWVTRIQAIDDLIPAAREAFLGGAFGFSVAYEISKASPQEQQELLEATLTGASREEIARRGRKQRNGTPAVKVDHVKIALPNNVAVVLSGNALDMAEVVTVLATVLKEAKRAAAQYDVKTFQSMMKDRAR